MSERSLPRRSRCDTLPHRIVWGSLYAPRVPHHTVLPLCTLGTVCVGGVPNKYERSTTIIAMNTAASSLRYRSGTGKTLAAAAFTPNKKCLTLRTTRLCSARPNKITAHRINFLKPSGRRNVYLIDTTQMSNGGADGGRVRA